MFRDFDRNFYHPQSFHFLHWRNNTQEVHLHILGPHISKPSTFTSSRANIMDFIFCCERTLLYSVTSSIMPFQYAEPFVDPILKTNSLTFVGRSQESELSNSPSTYSFTCEMWTTILIPFFEFISRFQREMNSKNGINIVIHHAQHEFHVNDSHFLPHCWRNQKLQPRDTNDSCIKLSFLRSILPLHTTAVFLHCLAPSPHQNWIHRWFLLYSCPRFDNHRMHFHRSMQWSNIFIINHHTDLDTAWQGIRSEIHGEFLRNLHQNEVHSPSRIDQDEVLSSESLLFFYKVDIPRHKIPSSMNLQEEQETFCKNVSCSSCKFIGYTPFIFLNKSGMQSFLFPRKKFCIIFRIFVQIT